MIAIRQYSILLKMVAVTPKGVISIPKLLRKHFGLAGNNSFWSYHNSPF